MAEARQNNPKQMLESIGRALQDPEDLPEIRVYAQAIINFMLRIARSIRSK